MQALNFKVELFVFWLRSQELEEVPSCAGTLLLQPYFVVYNYLLVIMLLIRLFLINMFINALSEQLNIVYDNFYYKPQATFLKTHICG